MKKLLLVFSVVTGIGDAFGMHFDRMEVIETEGSFVVATVDDMLGKYVDKAEIVETGNRIQVALFFECRRSLYEYVLDDCCRGRFISNIPEFDDVRINDQDVLLTRTKD